MTPIEPMFYSGWQAERTAFIGRLSGAGFALVTAATVLGLITLNVRSWGVAVVLMPTAAVLVALALIPVQGLTAEEWTALAVRHQIAVAKKRNIFVSGAFAPRTREGEQPLDLPGTLARLRILDAPDGLGGQLGVVHDPVAGTYAALCRVTHPGLALVDTDKQNARVRGWAELLRTLCTEDGAITRLAVHQRCLPDAGAGLHEWTAAHLDTDAPPEAVENVSVLMEGAGPVATDRETYLTITLSASRARLSIRGAGGGQRGAAAVLVRELHALQTALAGASVQVEEWLNARRVAEVVRVAYDPDVQPALAAHDARAASDPDWDGQPPGVAPEVAGPAAAETSWGRYRHDGGWTVSYQVRGLPYQEVPATVLQPLMRPRETARRSMSLVYEPLGPSRARRELSKERTKRKSARILRARTGKEESEDHLRESRTAHAQDIARAEGHGVVRLTAVLAVTVTDPDLLDTACAELQADAAAAGLTIRRMWGAQDVGFASAALPLGQGLPDQRSIL